MRHQLYYRLQARLLLRRLLNSKPSIYHTVSGAQRVIHGRSSFFLFFLCLFYLSRIAVGLFNFRSKNTWSIYENCSEFACVYPANIVYFQPGCVCVCVWEKGAVHRSNACRRDSAAITLVLAIRSIRIHGNLQ